MWIKTTHCDDYEAQVTNSFLLFHDQYNNPRKTTDVFSAPLNCTMLSWFLTEWPITHRTTTYIHRKSECLSHRSALERRTTTSPWATSTHTHTHDQGRRDGGADGGGWLSCWHWVELMLLLLLKSVVSAAAAAVCADSRGMLVLLQSQGDLRQGFEELVVRGIQR